MPIIPEEILRAINRGVDEPQLAEVAAYFFAECGGPREIAKMLWEEYTKASSGGQTRQKILDTILRLAKFSEDRSPKDDLDSMGADDLQREITRQLEKMGVKSGATILQTAAGDSAQPAAPGGAAGTGGPAALDSGRDPDGPRDQPPEEVGGGLGI